VAATSRRSRRRLVADLEARRCIVSKSVREAFLAVPREAFLPEVVAREGIEAVYRDEAFPTKHDSRGMPTSSSSQPAIMALMLERLDLGPGQHVLEIGAGTGYNAALLRELVGPRGEVVTVELDDDVARGARGGLRAARARARVVVADGHDGWPERAPYDRIIVTASSASVAVAWRDQLVQGGLVEVPLRLREVGPHAIATLRRDGDRLRSVGVLCGGFMPLRRAGVALEPPASLTASLVADGRSEPLAAVSGPGVRAMSRRSAGRLLGRMLAGPRVIRRLRLPVDDWQLALFLALELPSRRLVEAMSPLGIGVVDRRGRGMALLRRAAVPRGRAGAGQVLAFGDGDALGELGRVLARWERLGRPTDDRLRIDVTFDGSEARVRARWQTPR
jgi:protein-L-isoaspartate(D-aspartate) O-methyltransferase